MKTFRGKNAIHSEKIRVGKLIRKVRVHKDLTMTELAKRCGMTQQAISKYELGESEPSSKQLDRIADGLNCSRCDICPHNYHLEG